MMQTKNHLTERSSSESFLSLLLDVHKARKGDPAAIESRQRAQLAEMVAFVRAKSPYYREHYQGLPEHVDNPALLPVTDKKELMARFDDWATDRAVTINKAQAFVANPELIGHRFLGKYHIATTSGTTGTRGIFLQDDRSDAIAAALSAYMMLTWLNAVDLIRILASGGRSALLIATGGHFAGFAGFTRLRKSSRWRTRVPKIFSVYMPLPELVAQLNQFRPAILGGYASVISLLAREQEVGNLYIHPVLVHPSSEGLTQEEYERIAGAFGAKLRIAYPATECLVGIAGGCKYGWMHVNSDWVIVEPVEADYRPTPPGKQSHTVLISNLANRVQPVLRYDLGDSVLQRPDPCPCGNPMPAIRVQGRATDTLTFPNDHGEQIQIAPLVFSTLLDRSPGIEIFQIVQTAPARLRVRLRLAASADPDNVWQVVHTEITRQLAQYRLDTVAVERAVEPPEQSPGGKYREIIPLIQ